MDSEIEETHRQLQRSAALIQDAFEGLSTLHNRVSEASSIRVQSGGSAAPLPQPPVQRHPTSVGPVEDHSSRSTMDPGHDVIVISSDSDPTPIPSTSTLPPPSSSNSTSPRRAGTRPSDSPLASLRTELVASTQSVRDRAIELDDLRRSIFQYSQERNALPAEGTSPPATEIASRAQESSPTQSRVPGRRMLLEYSLRQRAANESATSLGMMVAARSTSPSNAGASSPNITASSTSPHSVVPTATSTSTSMADTTRTPVAPIPSGITSRVTRLAQEIQQDIARITAQSESLMEWINGHRSRLDAAAAVRSSGAASSEVTRRASSSVEMSNSQATSPIALSHPYPAEDARNPSPAGLSVSAVPRPPAPAQSETPTSSEMTRARAQATDEELYTPPSGSVIRPRRPPEGYRARYLRTSSTGFSSIAQSPGPRADSGWRALGSFSERTIAPPSMSPSTTITADAAASSGNVFRDPDFVEAANRVRAALDRARSLRRGMEEDDRDPERTAGYVVRRRLNADGEEEIVRFAMQPESSPGLGETMGRTREETEEADEDEEDADDAWLQALSRLDAMSRQTAARDAALRNTANPSSTSRWEPPPMTRGGTRLGTGSSRTYSTGPYTINLPQRDSRRLRDEPMLPEEAEAEYERDLAAMRARARSLISSAASARTLGGTTLPPPPPTDHVRRSLIFPVSSIQGTDAGNPMSSWRDPSARSNALRYQELFRQYEARSSHARGSAAATVSSPSPPLERARRDGTEGGAQAGADLERPMWGSPTPFYPSPLPLPLAQDVGSLEARSRAFAAPKMLARVPRRRGVAQAGC
ncbi:hypothetical protein L226DRAFT_527856 [Lentinus tigrinus ALCF2SS1-7]|uniref:uncharacterized protein n=1 Tax=Lentinus tigrinus ALCF2SS1-7 TaxID=1328758 RepID=UPI001165EAB1|nr:hypothetical protein L226DRAFT_527856 [Lentinus tigrinus ALCF2SS1-7]